MNFAKYLPDHWKEWLAARGRPLNASNFSGCRTVSVEFEDGSHAMFRYAFAVHDEQRNEYAVFTEHSGYHVFSGRGITVRQSEMISIDKINRKENQEEDD